MNRLPSDIVIPLAPTRDGNLRCPHCKMPGHRRTSEEVSITLRSMLFACSNPHCGHTWRASLSYDYGISPSCVPDPEMVGLELRTPRREDVMAAVRVAMRREAPDPNQFEMFAA